MLLRGQEKKINERKIYILASLVMVYGLQKIDI